MIKIIEFDECPLVYKKEMMLIEIYNIKVNVPKDIKYVVIDYSNVMYGYINKPIFVGHWKAGRESPTPIATVKFEGDIKESLIKL